MSDVDLGSLILQTLEQRGELDSYEFSIETGRDHQTVVGAIKSLQSVGNVSNDHKIECCGEECTVCRWSVVNRGSLRGGF